MADVITTLHPEGIPADNLYPNIKKENLPTQLQPVADFALSEYEKTLNLFSGLVNGYVDLSDGSFTDSSANLRSDYIAVNPNATYTISGMNFPVGNHIISYYTNTHAYIGRAGGESSSERTFTAPSNCSYIVLSNVSSLTSEQMEIARNAPIMMNEGTSRKPFVKFYGRIMHEIDCQGVTLWENGDSSSVFVNQNITVSSISEYSYLEIEYKYNKDLRVSQVMRVSTSLTGGTDSEFIISCSNQDQASNVASRSFVIQNDTTIYVGSGGFNGNPNQAYIIPVAIYGIK